LLDQNADQVLRRAQEQGDLFVLLTPGIVTFGENRSRLLLQHFALEQNMAIFHAAEGKAFQQVPQVVTREIILGRRDAMTHPGVR
jgi:hypothetical protein